LPKSRSAQRLEQKGRYLALVFLLQIGQFIGGFQNPTDLFATSLPQDVAWFKWHYIAASTAR